MLYNTGELTKIASWLYHNEPDNQARFEIYKATEVNIHPRSDIEHVFSDATAEVIERVRKQLNKPINKRKR